MKKHLPVFVIALSFFLASAVGVLASTYGFTGWGWSADDNSSQSTCGGASQPSCIAQGIGWTLFSNSAYHLATPFGVYVDGSTGELSGYSWNSNVGWVTFNTSDLVKCNTNPGDSCPVGSGGNPHGHINVKISPAGVITGNGITDGWARFCGVFVSGCSGALRPNIQRGGWDGWVSLAGPNYGIVYHTDTQQFTGYAWGGGIDSSGNAGFGWMSNFLGTAINITPPPVYGLTFWADSYSILSGSSVNLHWSTKGVSSCTASGDWSGAKDASDGTHTLSTGALTSVKTYNLVCLTSAGDTTGTQSVTVTIASSVTPEDGICGLANGVATHSKPINNLCEKGSASAVAQSGNNWEWTCGGVNGGSPASCSSLIKKAVKIIEI